MAVLSATTVACAPVPVAVCVAVPLAMCPSSAACGCMCASVCGLSGSKCHSSPGLCLWHCVWLLLWQDPFSTTSDSCGCDPLHLVFRRIVKESGWDEVKELLQYLPQGVICMTGISSMVALYYVAGMYSMTWLVKFCNYTPTAATWQMLLNQTVAIVFCPVVGYMADQIGMP